MSKRSMADTTHFVIDLETLSLASNAVISHIGVAAFVPGQGVVLGSLQITVDIDSCLAAGLVVDGSTLRWWLGQSPEARKAFKDKAVPLESALTTFRHWIQRYTKVASEKYRDLYIPGDTRYLWGNGPSFDLATLATAHRAVNTDVPWDFRNERCLRTQLDGFDAPIKFKGTRHRAEDDAVHEARQLQAYFKVNPL